MQDGHEDLGRAFCGAVESGAAEEEVDLLPGFTARLFNVQEALDLWTRPAAEQVLQRHVRPSVSLTGQTWSRWPPSVHLNELGRRQPLVDVSAVGDQGLGEEELREEAEFAVTQTDPCSPGGSVDTPDAAP